MSQNWRKGAVMDDDSWSDAEFSRATENWYSLSKTLAEGEALDYSKKHGLDVVTICPPQISGPLLQSTLLRTMHHAEEAKRRDWQLQNIRRSIITISRELSLNEMDLLMGGIRGTRCMGSAWEALEVADMQCYENNDFKTHLADLLRKKYFSLICYKCHVVVLVLGK